MGRCWFLTIERRAAASRWVQTGTAWLGDGAAAPQWLQCGGFVHAPHSPPAFIAIPPGWKQAEIVSARLETPRSDVGVPVQVPNWRSLQRQELCLVPPDCDGLVWGSLWRGG